MCLGYIMMVVFLLLLVFGILSVSGLLVVTTEVGAIIMIVCGFVGIAGSGFATFRR